MRQIKCPGFYSRRLIDLEFQSIFQGDRYPLVLGKASCPAWHSPDPLHQFPELGAVGRGAQGAQRGMYSIPLSQIPSPSRGAGCAEHRAAGILLTPPRFGVKGLFWFGPIYGAVLKPILNLACAVPCPAVGRFSGVLRLLLPWVCLWQLVPLHQDMCSASCASCPACHALIQGKSPSQAESSLIPAQTETFPRGSLQNRAANSTGKSKTLETAGVYSRARVAASLLFHCPQNRSGCVYLLRH